MILYIVTVKLPRKTTHNPQNKRTGACPANPNVLCTDNTGEHHSIAVNADNIEQAERYARSKGFDHITRVEMAGEIGEGTMIDDH